MENLLSLTQVDVRWGLNDYLSSFLEYDLIWHAANLQECTLETEGLRLHSVLEGM